LQDATSDGLNLFNREPVVLDLGITFDIGSGLLKSDWLGFWSTIASAAVMVSPSPIV